MIYLRVACKPLSQWKFSGKVREKAGNFEKLKCWPPWFCIILHFWGHNQIYLPVICIFKIYLLEKLNFAHCIFLFVFKKLITIVYLECADSATSKCSEILLSWASVIMNKFKWNLVCKLIWCRSQLSSLVALSAVLFQNSSHLKILNKLKKKKTFIIINWF